jgi:hypothetical protein
MPLHCGLLLDRATDLSIRPSGCWLAANIQAVRPGVLDFRYGFAVIFTSSCNSMWLSILSRMHGGWCSESTGCNGCCFDLLSCCCLSREHLAVLISRRIEWMCREHVLSSVTIHGALWSVAGRSTSEHQTLHCCCTLSFEQCQEGWIHRLYPCNTPS